MLLLGDFVGFSKDVSIPDFPDCGIILANLEGAWTHLGDGQKRAGLPRKAGPRLWNTSVEVSSRWVFCLANNHMMDFGDEGLRETVRRCQERKIRTVGAGMNLQEACAPLIVEEEGKRIGILACAEHQFGMATDTTPGVAPLGVWLFEAIRALRRRVDVVIVSCHAAVEMSPVPSPERCAFYRALIEAGADVVHGHHAHVPQGWEQYNNGRIYYGLGNFLVNPAAWGQTPNTLWSLAVRLRFAKDGLEDEVFPVGIRQGGGVTRVVPLTYTGRLYDYIKALSGCLAEQRCHRGVWQAVACSLYHSLYEHNLGFYPIGTTRLSGRDWCKRLYHSAKTVLAFIRGREKSAYPLVQYNYTQCESHQELIAEAMGVELGIRQDCRTSASESIYGRLLKDPTGFDA